MSERADVLVLGAGAVGVPVALHLQQRGRSVVLADRRSIAEETSFGNAGIIQREGIVPYMFPRAWAKLVRYALKRGTEANYHVAALPRLAPWLWHYWRASSPERAAASARALMPLIVRCIDEHMALMRAAGVEAMARPTGYLKLYRSEARLAEALRSDADEHSRYGVNFRHLETADLAALEPSLVTDRLAGAIHMPDPVTVPDPRALLQAYGAQFEAGGGRVARADALTLARDGEGWQIAGDSGAIRAREVVVALGPWSTDLLARFAKRLPMAAKRGYHRHYGPAGTTRLGRPVIDVEHGYVLAPMTQGIRLTTGAEFALRDAPASPRQLALAEPRAREILPLAGPIEPTPWLGARPCFPDMLPAIGPLPGVPGLWLCCGHQHLGLTLGPVSARLLAEMMTGAAPFTDATPYRVERFA
ncbi:MAG: NAD(P)/FAD-dependent oxidoreductase [Hyphomicrobiaceae bacterium]